MKRGRNYQSHAFEQVFQEYGIEHRLTQFRHPWTNGEVERMNRTIKQATIKTYHYETIDSLRRHLYDFLNAYNFAQRLKILRFLTSIQKILDEFQQKPHLFYTNPSHYSLGLRI